MDPFYAALNYFRARKFEKCVDACTQILTANPLDQVLTDLCLTALKNYLHSSVFTLIQSDWLEGNEHMRVYSFQTQRKMKDGRCTDVA
jgi:hypothetical protein